MNDPELDHEIRMLRRTEAAFGNLTPIGFAPIPQTPEQKAEREAQLASANRQQAVSMASTALIHSGCSPKELVEMAEAIRLYCETGAVPGQTANLHVIGANP